MAATTAADKRACAPDSKLLGRYELTTSSEVGSWWRLTRDGFDAAGVTDYEAFIERAFGMSFASLHDAIAHLVLQASTSDANGNGFVCAYETRGTRTSIGDPNLQYYLFYVRDDR